jgi:response regulator RpfG family c-di-GMP phosphodiesterase
MTNRRVLFVDDESNVVDGIKRLIRKSFDVYTSTNPKEALAELISQPDFAVVVSDMRMPQMSGVEFLSAVKIAKPDTVRIMLTGNQDQQTAAAAVNEGEVFKFLNKPVDAESLTKALEQGLRQYQLVTAERDLLSRTLQGSIKVLLEALSLCKPEVFGSIDRIERRCSQLAEGLAGIEPWEMRAAARLSRLGCIGLPGDALRKNAVGKLNAEERARFEGHPALGAKLVGEIPRLEQVAECIRYQLKNFDGSGVPADPRRGEEIPLGARLLRLVHAFDDLQMRGASDTQALASLRANSTAFDPALLEKLVNACTVAAPVPFRVSIEELKDGMTIAEDVENTKGLLIVCRGQEVTPAIQRHLAQFLELGTLDDSILVTAA